MDSIDKNSVNDIILRQVISEDAVVRAYVYAATRGHRDTEDVTQEVWQIVCLRNGDYDPSRSSRAWILRITRLQVLKWRQAQARSREILAPDVLDLLADTAAIEKEELSLRGQYLRDCLSRMPVSGRRLLQLRYFEGLRSADIAEKLKRNVGAVDMAFVRLRRALRACIEEKLAQPLGGGL
ncbi:MAG: sigma-70 family RNA polymerase sigma factor [bacterium]